MKGAIQLGLLLKNAFIYRSEIPRLVKARKISQASSPARESVSQDQRSNPNYTRPARGVHPIRAGPRQPIH